MTRAGAVALGLAAILLIACGTSKVADDAQVTVSGTLLLPTGSPAAGVTVGLIEEPDAISALVELTATISTVGLLCLSKTVAICKGARKSTTASDGRYSFAMNGKDSKNIFGNPARFLLSAQLPSGAQLQTRFELTTATIAVPTTTFWEPAQLSASPGPQQVAYSFTEFSPRPAGYRVSLTRSEETIWIQAGSPSGKIDARALADADADFHAIASAQRQGVGVTFTTDYHTPRIALHGMASPPGSRGASCSVAGASGPAAIEPCMLTDATYSGSFPSQSCPAASPTPAPSAKRCTANSWVQLDLGTAKPLSAVFLHGLGMSAEAVIETSDDGLKWTKRARTKPLEFLMIALPTGSSGRYVRLKSANDTDTIFSLAEFAVY
jgi:hypothetical protein